MLEQSQFSLLEGFTGFSGFPTHASLIERVFVFRACRPLPCYHDYSFA